MRSDAEGASILVVDDERNVRRLLVDVLCDEGHRARAAENVAELRQLLANERFDLILLDVCLPSGEDGLDWLRSGGSHPPVIMMSGHATIDTAVEATQLGALDFLEKPIAVERLCLSVQNALTLGALRRENARLRRKRGSPMLLGASPEMRAVLAFIDRVSATDAMVLITGEHGTGKELVAQAIHSGSPRAEAPFVRVNCAAIPRDLLESELFGHERGAFSGAVERRRGRFEIADRGTLLLDEIGEMDIALQAKLLRVLEEKEITPLGAEKAKSVDVRVLASTNRQLPERVSAGEFRADLYYRLNVLSVEMPPLRRRRGDVRELSVAFLEEFAERHGRSFEGLREGAMERLTAHRWPGNVRELRNTLERAVILADGPWLSADDVEVHLDVATPDCDPSHEMAYGSLRERLDSYERRLLQSTLEECGGNLAEVGRRLETDRANLHRRLRRLGLRREQP